MQFNRSVNMPFVSNLSYKGENGFYLSPHSSPNHLSCRDEFQPVETEIIAKTPAIYLELEIRDRDKEFLTTLQLQDRLAKNKDLKRSKKYRKEWILDSKDSKRGRPAQQTKDILFTIKVYQPLSGDTTQVKGKRLREMKEILVLGNNTLAQLRDSIVCPNDLAVPGDHSENPNIDSRDRSKDLYKSGLFFIEDVFYNDMRLRSNVDYSECIINWAKDPRRGLGAMGTARMEQTKFKHLNVRLGYPYVYLHQGACEHLLVFTQIRLLHPTDPQGLTNYPRIGCISSHRSHYCMMCNLFMARWITTTNERIPLDPFIWCDRCYRIFNYPRGQKRGEFRAHTYFDRTAIL